MKQQQHQYDEPDEESQRLNTLFTDMENRQLDFLDEAGKSIIERIATFLAILFAVTAFSGNFPPAYLKGNILDKYLVFSILGSYIVAMGMAIWAIQPRSYKRYLYNVTRMQKELDLIVKRKKYWINAAGILFALGTLALVWLIGSIIWNV